MTSNDMDLVRDYAAHHSEEAFATLVSRYINLVYSVALRRLGDPHLAEEATQAVFIILSRKAGSLGPKTILSAWLCRTAQYAAADALKAQRRRHNREQELYMQSLLNQPESAPSPWLDIAPLLDDAMGRLGEKDHCAIVLRYFDGKDLKEVGAALGVSENTAKTRVSRAMDKLRKFFARRGIHLSSDVIAGAIAVDAVQAAPAALAKAVTAIVLSKGVTASASTLGLTKAILLTMKAKTVVIIAAATTLLIATGAYIMARAHHPRASAASHDASDTVPTQFANADFNQDGNSDGKFTVDVDSAAKRTAGSQPAIHIKGPVPPASPNADYQRADNSSSTRYFVTDGSPLLGKRIRVTGWLKTSGVKQWAGTFVILSVDGQTRYYDDMSDRPIRGTTDWQPFEIDTDVPNEPCIIYFGPDLYGAGELWADDFHIDIAPPGTGLTDVRTWRMTGETFAYNYTATDDYLNLRDGKPTVCLTYATDAKPPRGSFAQWEQRICGPELDQYKGHTIRMTGWVKTEGVSGRLEPFLHALVGHYQRVGRESKVQNCNLKGTRDWVEFNVTCAVPKTVDYLETGFILAGTGKAWIDKDSIKREIVK